MAVNRPSTNVNARQGARQRTSGASPGGGKRLGSSAEDEVGQRRQKNSPTRCRRQEVTGVRSRMSLDSGKCQTAPGNFCGCQLTSVVVEVDSAVSHRVEISRLTSLSWSGVQHWKWQVDVWGQSLGVIP